MSETLEPCPFCGEEVTCDDVCERSKGEGAEGWDVTCDSCCGSIYHPRRDDAIRDWNRRAAPPPLAWSTEPPTVPGLYWVESPDSHEEPAIAAIGRNRIAAGNWPTGLRFAGPIPEPVEPQP